MPTVLENDNFLKENYEYFKTILPEIIGQYAGKFALIRNKKIINYYDTARDAYTSGKLMFQDEKFSVQEVINKVIDLGYYSHAVY